MTVHVLKDATAFAEDKDVAAEIRENCLRPAMDAGEAVVLDFTGVRLTTQSFIHALISDVLRRNGEGVLELITFKGCNRVVRGVIKTVVQYSLEGVGE